MVGRLSGTIADRPVQLDANREVVTLRLDDVASAFALRRYLAQSVGPLRNLSSVTRLRVAVKIGSWPSLNLFPKPSPLLRVVVPEIR